MIKKMKMVEEYFAQMMQGTFKTDNQTLLVL